MVDAITSTPSYEHQLEIKAGILKENLRRIAKLELQQELMIHPSPPWNYRNRTRLKVQTAPQFALGYYRLNSHELLPVEQCPISSPLINRAIGKLWELGRAGEIVSSLKELELFANADDSQLLVEAYCASETADSAKSWAEQLHQALARGDRRDGSSELARSNPHAGAAAESKLISSSGAAALDYKTKGALTGSAPVRFSKSTVI